MAGLPRLLTSRLPASLSSRVFTTSTSLRAGAAPKFEATREEVHPAIGMFNIIYGNLLSFHIYLLELCTIVRLWHLSDTVHLNFLGKREILCWGFNGDPSQYVGDPSFPAQSVRFQEDSEYVANVLRAKEKGDWRQMTLEEKKTRMF